MTSATTTLAAGAAALALLLSGCGSDTKAEPSATEATSTSASEASATSTSASPTSAAPTTSGQAAGPNETVADYLRANGIGQTLVKRGEPGTPTLNLPMPAGWKDLGPDTPPDAWGAIVLDDPALGNDVPAIIARMARLTGGTPDPAKILELAPNALRNQPGYQGPETGQQSTLGGFDASAISGTLTKDGQTVLVARKTVVIPGQDGMYVLALDAQGPEAQQQALMDAMATIDQETTIEP